METKFSLRAGPNQPRVLPTAAVASRRRFCLGFTVSSLLVVFIILQTGLFDKGTGIRNWFSSLPTESFHQPSPETGDDSPWLHIEPSRTIEWHVCYDNAYDCARLDVPMDWQNPSEEDRVFLAVLRLRAKDPRAANYRGPLIFNPGGPGGSGLSALLDHGDLLQKVVGDNFDIVSFDPRGIGASVPRVECWGSAQDRMKWDLQDAGVADLHPGAVYEAFARATAFSKTCQATMGKKSILRHSSTTSHARDMLEIMEQMGQEKLQYWGFSYGTVLGGTFAAMYPDRVGRLVSDGNVDLKEWYYGRYINFLRDADKVMEAFYDLCYQAGPERCAMYQNSTTAIRDRLDSLLETLRVAPVIVSTSTDGPEVPELVTYTSAKRLISTMLYQPLRFFRIGAQILAGLERGDGALFMQFASALRPSDSFCAAETVPPTVPISGPGADSDDAFPAIMCADRQVNDTVQEFEKYAARLQRMSSAAGAVQIVFRLSCIGWDVTPKWRFDGPFAGNTSFPILYISNIADNVTPLISARNNSAGFPGSVVLVQNSYGHTSLAAPSRCTASYVREYFQQGTLPAKDTVCEADAVPFFEDMVETQSGGDDELSAAINRLSRETNWGLKFRQGYP